MGQRSAMIHDLPCLSTQEIPKTLFPVRIADRLAASASVCKEIQYIPSVCGISPIKFRIAASGTAYGYEFLILHIKNLGEIPAGCLKLIRFICITSAFRADILHFFHVFFLRLLISHYTLQPYS
jgi:hypothetical protein